MTKMRLLRVLQLLLSLALLISICIGQEDWHCIPSCKCIWASGKRTAECRHQNFNDIPANLSKEIQYLDLTGNFIAHLNSKAFTRVELDNLQKLIMRDCNIRAVNSEAFHGLRIVIEIDLTGNRIRQLHRGTFNQTERLRVLLLNDNRLQKLDDDLFYNLLFLQKVELSNNRLIQIGQWTFKNLPGLQTLTLDGNNLTSLNMKSFEDLPKLGSLELRKNPWNCDCHLKPFRDWAIQRKLYTKPTSCERPEALYDRMWDEISSDEFACVPQIQNIGTLQRGDAGSGSAHLWCKATASPKPQITWVYRQRVLTNDTKRHASDKIYVILQNDEWSNLTIPDISLSDKGEYICIAKNFGGSMEKNVSLVVLGEGSGSRDSIIGLRLAIGLGVLAIFFLLVALTMCLCYCQRKRSHHDEKSAEAASLDHHGLGEQEKSLITAINPVVKPPRRYEAPSVTSHGTEMTELNRTLLDNDSVFADGVGSVVGVLANGLNDEERVGRATPDLDSVLGGHGGHGGSGIGGVGSVSGGSGGGIGGIGIGGMSSLVGTPGHGASMMSGVGTLSRNSTPYRQYPPDLLAFSGGRNSSPTSQASTAPDSSRLPAQPGAQFSSPSSPASASAVVAYTPIGFKTLPHPARASSATPYSLGHHHPAMPRHGYVTIPRRPRAPSWSSGPPTSPTDREIAEPVYDNLGLRTTADGSSVLSLCKSPEPGHSMRGRPLPATPTGPASSPSSPSIIGSHNGMTLPRVSRAIPALQLQLNRSAPEGAAEWPINLVDEKQKQQKQQQQQQQQQQQHEQQKEDDKTPKTPTTPTTTTATMNGANTNTLTHKVPPRPPPKPKKKNPNGPLYEDEGEDGTEV